MVKTLDMVWAQRGKPVITFDCKLLRDSYQNDSGAVLVFRLVSTVVVNKNWSPFFWLPLAALWHQLK